MHKVLLPALLSLGGCAHYRPDPYSGYYVGNEAVVRIAPCDSGLFLVVLGEKDRETSLIGKGTDSVLKAGSGAALEIIRDRDGYHLRMPGREDRIQRTDSLRYEKSRIALFGEP